MGLGGTGGGDGAGSNGGGGAGLGGAVFLAEGSTVTILATRDVTITANRSAGGQGGRNEDGSAAAGNGASAGDFLFTQGDLDLDFTVEAGVEVGLDGQDLADPTGFDGTSSAVLGLNKLGDGTLTLAGNPAFSGDIDVRDGRLNVGGDFGASDVNVASGAILSGSGRVGNLSNSGRLEAGNSVGTLRVAGDFTQGSNGTLEAEFDRTGIDSVLVDGSADIDGGLELVEIGGGVETFRPLVILRAEDGITGTFDVTETLAADTSVEEIRIEQDANQITATFIPGSSDFGGQATSGTGQQVGSALDELFENNREASIPLLNAVNALDDREGTLQSQGNILASSAAFAGATALTQVAGVAQNRLSGVAVSAEDIARGYDRFSAIDPADTYDGYPYGTASADYVDPAAYPLARADEGDPIRPALWVELVGATSEVDSDTDAFGFDAETFGVAVGGDLKLNDDSSIVGVFLGFTGTEVEVEGLDDESDVDNLQLGLYGAHRFDDAWHVNATASVAFLTFDTTRPTALGTATGDFDGLGLQGSAEVLYDFSFDRNVRISPLIGVEAAYLDRDGYTESGAGLLNLDVDGGTNEYLTSIVGAEIAAGFPSANLDWVVAVRAGFAYQFLDTAASTTSRFASTGTGFTTSGAERDESSFRLGAHLEFSPLDSHRWTAFARYDLDVASNASENVFRGGFRLSF